MIDSLTVWHGPVAAMYDDSAAELIKDIEPTIVPCRDTSPAELGQLLPELSIFQPEMAGVWLRGIDSWKADEVASTLSFLKKHSQNFVIAVTTTKTPIKAIKDAALAIHDFEPPKKGPALARQIEDWLLLHNVGIEPSTGTHLAKRCAQSPEHAHIAATQLRLSHTGRTATLEDVDALLDSVLEEHTPIWALGESITVSTAAAIATARKLTDDNANNIIGALRYLETRYRQAILILQKAPADAIRIAFPSVTDWGLRKTHTDMLGMTVTDAAGALEDVAQAFKVILAAGDTSAKIAAFDACVVRLAARHAHAKAR